MKKVIFILIISLFLLFGCTSLTPEDIVQSNKGIQVFLEEHPDSEISYSIYEEKETEQLNAIFPDCTIPQKEKYYLITVKDNNSDSELKTLIHQSSNLVVCLFKDGENTQIAPVDETCNISCTDWVDNCETEGTENRNCEFQYCDDSVIDSYEVLRECE